MNGNAFWNFCHGVGVILNKWTDEITVGQEAAIIAAWGDWTPEDVETCVKDGHSHQRHVARQHLNQIFWDNHRPIHTRVWTAPANTVLTPDAETLAWARA